MNTKISLRIERDVDGIVTVVLDVNPEKPRGGVVVLDRWLIDQIRMAMEVVEAGQKPSGLILMSASSRVFVAGADLAEIDALGDEELHEYLKAGSRAFGMLSRQKCPSVAVIHKAALGGGLEVAMHCQALIGTLPAEGEKPWRIGLPECGLGICPGWGGTQMLPARMAPAEAIQATAAGTTWECGKMPEGLMTQVLPAGSDLLAAARAWIRGPGTAACQAAQQREWQPLAINHSNARPMADALRAARASLPPSKAASAVAECVEAGIQNGFEAGLAAERKHLVSLRHTPEAREKLAAFLKR